MLLELRIRDFAIIDQLELRFDGGLVTFTGETGAGKSIIIDAVEALLGGRVDISMIRTGTERAGIEGDFSIPDRVRERVLSVLKREDLADEQDFVTLGREIRPEGRHIARINGRSVTVGLLKEIGEFLVDVHGQSEHLSLLRIREHLRLLDSYAGIDGLLRDYREVYSELRIVQKSLADLRAAERDAARRADLLRYQIDEIKAAALKPGEEDALKKERSRLANAEALAKQSQEAIFALDESSPAAPSATDLVGQAVNSTTQVARMDETQGDMARRMQEIFESLADLTMDLRDYADSIEFNPARLREVEERLDLIQNLKRKYGSGIRDILAFAESAASDLDAITNAEERIQSLEKDQARLFTEIAGRGEVLFAARKQAADGLSHSLEEQLQELRMEEARFGVEFIRKPDPAGVKLENGECVAYGPNGLESVQFLVAPNPGEGLKPMAKIASGGEMSRLMLAIKNVLAQADPTPTLIFDEIDQGIGGRVGAVVGEKLSNLAHDHQVLCITHLPQLAAFGAQHYRVTKHIAGGRTTTRVSALEGSDRLAELAQMLGDVTEATLESAREMLVAVEST